MKTQKIYYDIFSANLGQCVVALTDQGLCSIRMVGDASYLAQEFPKASIVQDNTAAKQYVQKISDYLNGKTANLDLACDIQGTKFQKQVWQALQKIPLGTTCYYSE